MLIVSVLKNIYFSACVCVFYNIDKTLETKEMAKDFLVCQYTKEGPVLVLVYNMFGKYFGFRAT